MSLELTMLLQQTFHYQIQQLPEKKVWKLVSICIIPVLEIVVLLMLCNW